MTTPSRGSTPQDPLGDVAPSGHGTDADAGDYLTDAETTTEE